MSEDNLCTIFDFSEKKKNETAFRDIELSEKYEIDDNAPNENKLTPSDISINFCGVTYSVYFTSGGLALLDNELLSPIAEMEQLEIFERFNGKQLYFAVKSGLIIQAIILPSNPINEKFMDQIRMIGEQAEITFENNKKQEAFLNENSHKSL